MKYRIQVERHYPQGIDDVWTGLTDKVAISEWLMETDDFEAATGHCFKMSCRNDEGHLDVYRCQVLDIERPHRMALSWVVAGKEERGVTEVEFRLTATDKGTTVVVTHSGDRDQATLDRFRKGWPDKLARLADTLDQRASQRN